MKRICSIYKSPRKNEMYLYVLKADGLERVPEGLLPAFGKPVHAFDLVLSPERQLAREDITKVLEKIKKLKAEDQLRVTTQIFGKEYGKDAAKLSNNLDELYRQLKLVNEEKSKGSGLFPPGLHALLNEAGKFN